MIPFPNVSPEIFSVQFLGFSFALRWYAVSYILGFICALWLMKYFTRCEECWPFRRPPLNSLQVDSLFTYLILGVILGGRLGYVLFYNLSYYLTNPTDVLRI